jgi:hypothetical protein
MIELSNTGLKHKECLKILQNEIENELKNYKNEKIKFNIIIKNFLDKNFIQFLHNFLIIFLCSIFIFILNTDG